MLTTKQTLAVVLFLLLATTRQLAAQEMRNAWLWPYDKYSIWNMPIGSGAEYIEVDLVPEKGVGVDTKHILELKADDPIREVIGFSSFAPEEGRCAGTADMRGLTVNIPDDWIVPDIVPDNPFGLTPNSSFVFRLAGTDSVWNGPAIARCTEEGPLYMFEFQKWPNNRIYEHLHSDGVTRTGGQGASSMSGLGGTIRLGELTGGEPIRHAIKINPWGHHLYYSEEIPGYKWPATSADNYANIPGHKNAYVGTNPDLVMGTLLAIPPDVTAESLGLNTIPGKKLFFTLQNYGAYITEDAGWDVLDLIVERNVEQEFEAAYGFSMTGDAWAEEVKKLAAAFKIIVNNTPETIGGGGTRRQPLAPNFDGSPVTGMNLDKGKCGMQMFPNPVGDVLTISTEGNMKLTILNLLGKVMMTYRIPAAGHFQIDTSTLTSGLYIIHYVDKQTRIVKN